MLSDIPDEVSWRSADLVPWNLDRMPAWKENVVRLDVVLKYGLMNVVLLAGCERPPEPEFLSSVRVQTLSPELQVALHAAQIWRGSKMDQKREILDAVSLNRLLGDVTLVVEKRKPFDELAKRPLVTPSRGDRI